MESVYLNGGYIGITSEYLTKYSPISSFSYIASSEAVQTNNLTIPSSSQSGDIAVIVDNINSSTNISAPSGWTLISSNSAGDTNLTAATYYKVLVGGDPGSTVASPNTSTTDHFMACAIFRPSTNSEIASAILNDVDGQATTGDPSADTVTMSGSSPPLIGFIAFFQRGGNANNMNITSEPAADGYVEVLKSTLIKIRLYYKIYNVGNTPVDMSGDIADSGAQGIISWYFTFTSQTGIKQYNDGIWNLQSVLEAIEA